MSTVLNQAADLTHGTPNAIDNTASSVPYALADAGLVVGQFCEFVTTLTTTHIRWGTADSVACSHSNRNAGTPPATTAATNAPHVSCFAGIPRRVRIPRTIGGSAVTHFAVISEAASGVLRFSDATGEG